MAVETVFFREGEPWRIHHLDEVGDILFDEGIFFVDGGQGAQVEGTGRLGGREDLVHGSAHCLLNSQRERVESDHGKSSRSRSSSRWVLLPDTEADAEYQPMDPALYPLPIEYNPFQLVIKFQVGSQPPNHRNTRCLLPVECGTWM